MAEKIILKGRGLVGGVVEGEALVSTESLVWSHGVDPASGRIDDVRVAVYGESVRGKVLVYPLGKGSTSGATWMLETTRCGNAPAAIINRETELIILTGVLLSKALYDVNIPVVDRLDQNPDETIESGDWVRIDGTQGIVEVVKRKKCDGEPNRPAD
jgi:predicted aconitase with swiveling domain